MRVLLVVLMVLGVGCSGPAGVVDAGTGGGGGIINVGGGIAGGGTGGGSTGGGAATGGGGNSTGGGSSTGGGGATSGGGGGGGGGGVPGSVDAGARCTATSDCAAGTCVEWYPDAGSLCAPTCFDQAGCAALPNFFCSPLPDGTGVCVPRSPAHCLPCDFDENCGSTSEVCVTGPGETTQTCRIDCSLAGADACPPEYTCTQLMFRGMPRALCLPPMACPSAKAGFCDRYAATQPCATGNDAGTCIGARPCMNDRFDTCNAITPQCRATCASASQTGCLEELCPAATQTPDDCGACGMACPGAGQATATVDCNTATCSFACRGENYDVDNAQANGCEVADSPTGNHTATTATSVGDRSCSDSSTISLSGRLTSDTRTHTPAVPGFDATKGAAPDYFKVNATGGICVNDLGVTITVTGAGTGANCFLLTISTSNGSYSCQTSASGTCTISEGSNSYDDDTTITLSVTRTCAAAGVDARYTVAGHF